MSSQNRAVHRNLRLVEAKLPVDKSRVGKVIIINRKERNFVHGQFRLGETHDSCGQSLFRS